MPEIDWSSVNKTGSKLETISNELAKGTRFESEESAKRTTEDIYLVSTLQDVVIGAVGSACVGLGEQEERISELIIEMYRYAEELKYYSGHLPESLVLTGNNHNRLIESRDIILDSVREMLSYSLPATYQAVLIGLCAVDAASKMVGEIPDKIRETASQAQDLIQAANTKIVDDNESSSDDMHRIERWYRDEPKSDNFYRVLGSRTVRTGGGNSRLGEIPESKTYWNIRKYTISITGSLRSGFRRTLEEGDNEYESKDGLTLVNSEDAARRRRNNFVDKFKGKSNEYNHHKRIHKAIISGIGDNIKKSQESIAKLVQFYNTLGGL